MKNTNVKGGNTRMNLKNLAGALGLTGVVALGGCNDKDNFVKRASYTVNDRIYQVDIEQIGQEERRIYITDGAQIVKAKDYNPSTNYAFDEVNIFAPDKSAIRSITSSEELEKAWDFTTLNGKDPYKR